MASTSKHYCRTSAVERRATPDAPYQFVDSGLDNVFLNGIRYWVCESCGTQRAEIPAPKQLMTAIARTLVKKKSPLIGPEIRFLRKRLGQRSADFAQMIGVSLEQLSRWENDKNPPRESADRLIRVVYSLLSKDRKLRGLVGDNLQQWITSIHSDGLGERIVAYRVKHEWKVEAEPFAA